MMQAVYEQTEALVRQCGELLLHRVNGPDQIHHKGAVDFVTDTDFAISNLLCEGLVKILPGSRVVTEEQPEHDFSYSQPTWVIDPLDGTSNYVFDLHLSAVSVALLRHGEPVLGIVYNPYAGEMFHALRGQGAFLNGERIHAAGTQSLMEGLVSVGTSPYHRELSGRTFEKLRRVFERCVDIRRLGSAALDMAAVACGRSAGFYEEQLSPWDYAAGALLVSEAGGKATRADGSPLRFDGKESMVAAGAGVHAELLELVRSEPAE